MEEKRLQDAMLEAKDAEADESLPTGRCRITVASINQCTNGMTQRACYQVASNVGGVADWTEGARCP